MNEDQFWGRKLKGEQMALPTTHDERKDTPIFSGVIRYFPDALAQVARLSKLGNDKHNPGQPLHWAKGKSTDHGDCILRHQMEFDEVDPDTGFLHAVAVAWRALAQLQMMCEAQEAGYPYQGYIDRLVAAEKDTIRQ